MYLKMLIFGDQTLNVLFNPLALNVRQSIELFQMVTHGVDILPASHDIVRMQGWVARRSAPTFSGEPRDPFHMRS